jgi:hypothetical protein
MKPLKVKAAHEKTSRSNIGRQRDAHKILASNDKGNHRREAGQFKKRRAQIEEVSTKTRSAQSMGAVPERLVQSSVNVPVLERFFDDSEILLASNDTESDLYPVITPSSPLASNAQDVRGIKTEYVNSYFQAGLHRFTPPLYDCEYFRSYYYPPWHFLAHGRKSRPAVGFTFADGGSENNGAIVPTGVEKPTTLWRSRNPFKSGWWRSNMKKMGKRTFYKAFNTFGEPDGVYWFWYKRACEDEGVLNREMENCIVKAINMAEKDRFEWIENANRCINMKRVNSRFQARNMKPFSWQNRLLWSFGGKSCERLIA